jgi:hypothetical protein
MGNYRMSHPVNEPVKSYAPGSPEREKLKSALNELKSKQIEVPLVIDGKEIRTDMKIKMTTPRLSAQPDKRPRPPNELCLLFIFSSRSTSLCN